MSRFLRYESCPRCRSNGHDNRGDNLGRYADGSGHCFACGYHEFPKHAYVLAQQREVTNVPKSLLPADFTREVPTRALAWLLQYGLPYSYWESCLGYSQADERLVFTVGASGTFGEQNHLAFSIGRYVGPKTGKAAPRKWYVYGDSHKHCEIVTASCSSDDGNGPVVVLVEDIVSAHKVANAGLIAIPLFGTRVFPACLYYLIQSDLPVVLWLDKDQELNVKKQALQLESIIGRPVKVVTTEKDPKCLSFDEIQHTLGV